MRHLIAVLALAAALALAACASGSGSSASSSPSALAARIGCTGFSSMAPTLNPREEELIHRVRAGPDDRPQLARSQ